MPRKKKETGSPDASSPKGVTQEAIETLAYYKWLERGCPHDDPQIDWLAAEKELKTKSE